MVKSEINSLYAEIIKLLATRDGEAKVAKRLQNEKNSVELIGLRKYVEELVNGELSRVAKESEAEAENTAEHLREIEAKITEARASGDKKELEYYEERKKSLLREPGNEQVEAETQSNFGTYENFRTLFDLIRIREEELSRESEVKSQDQEETGRIIQFQRKA